MSHSQTHSLGVNMYQGEGGWTFKYTHDWIDYHGSLSPENETGLLGHLLASKPQLFEMAITNKDYKLTAVGEDVMMALELKSVFETVIIKLKREVKVGGDGEVEMRQLKGRVSELEMKMKAEREEMKLKVGDLEKEMRELKLVGERYVPTPTVKEDELMRYAMAFYVPFIAFAKKQLNTTAVEAFAKWKTTCDETLWQLTIEYLARVRNLSMKTLAHVNIVEYIGYPAATKAQLPETPYLNGLYTNGCWNVSAIKQDAITEDMRLLGPYQAKCHSYGVGGRGHPPCHQTDYTLWLQVTPLTPLTPTEKLKHNLS